MLTLLLSNFITQISVQQILMEGHLLQWPTEWRLSTLINKYVKTHEMTEQEKECCILFKIKMDRWSERWQWCSKTSENKMLCKVCLSGFRDSNVFILQSCWQQVLSQSLRVDKAFEPSVCSQSFFLGAGILRVQYLAFSVSPGAAR